MNAQELRGKSVDDLQNELVKLHKEQFQLRMQKGSGQELRGNEFKRVRRTIARVKTVLNEKAQAAE
ncbi:MAG: 50S ribosomal protein L29 [Gammaproteobacteria bacterium]|nr:50S ribosomal protein L29 [Gammaproteobacteria bacterium]